MGTFASREQQTTDAEGAMGKAADKGEKPSTPKRPRTYTQDFRDQVVDHYRDHGPTAASKKFDVPLGTVSAWAVKAGAKTTAASKTRARTENFVEQIRARQSKLAADLVADAERLRADAHKPLTYHDWGGKDHDFDEREVQIPVPADRLKLIQAASAALDQASKLLEHTASTKSDALSMLTKLADTVGLPETKERL